MKSQTADKKNENIESAAKELKEITSDSSNQIKQKLGKSIREVRSEASEGFSQVGQAVKTTGSALYDEASEATKRTAAKVSSAVKKKPLPVLLGVAVGSFFAGILMGRKN